jgi:hypothetical protein
MIKFSDFLEDLENRAQEPNDAISDIRTELKLIEARIVRANALLSHTRDAELTDAKDLLLDLQKTTEDFLNSINDIVTGRSFHV